MALLAIFSVFNMNALNSSENPQNSPSNQEGTILNIATSLGNIKVLLYDDTPIHRDNFLKLVKEDFYNDLLFHRVIKNFMVQTGDPNSRGAAPGVVLGSGDPNYTLEAEIVYPKHFHKYGALAAARTADQVNPLRRSSSSQFYIVTGNKYSADQLEAMNQRQVMPRRQAYFNNLVREHSAEIDSIQKAGNAEALENLRLKLVAETEAAIVLEPLPQNLLETYSTIGGAPFLDDQYTVFGEVLEGMDVVEKIQGVATDQNDRPLEDVKIISISIEK